MFYVKYGSRGAYVPMYLVSAADGFTPVTGKITVDFVLSISRGNGVFYAIADVDINSIVTELGYGYYVVLLSNDKAPDVISGTLGPMIVHNETVGCRVNNSEGFVLPADTYDALFSTGTFELSSATITDVAKAVLTTDFAACSTTNTKTLLNAARKLTNKVAISGNTLTIYKEDGVAQAFTQTVGTNSSQQPIVSLNTV